MVPGGPVQSWLCGEQVLGLHLPPVSSSLSPTQDEKSDKERWQHLADLADFALAMKDTLTNINNQSFNNFMLRIGKTWGNMHWERPRLF